MATFKDEIKEIISEFPDIRHNISEDTFNSKEDYDDCIENHCSYFGDEWENWEHMDIEERWKYFSQIFDTIKKLKEKVGIKV